MLADVVRVLGHLDQVLRSLQIRYVVGGSLASSVHGELRATNDVDVLIDLSVDHVARFVDALKPRFDIWEDTVRNALAQQRSFSALHIEWHVKIDFFPAGRTPLDAVELDRSEDLRIPASPNVTVPVATAEDIILRKLCWYEQSDGVLERQLRDVVGVLKVRGADLDQSYLRRWADALGVAHPLDRCLQAADLLGEA